MFFAAIFIPDFILQAAVRAEPDLRGRAVAVLEGTPPLRTVVAASDAALQAGIRLGMTKAQAEPFQPLEMRNRSRAQEQAAHAALLDLGWCFSPRVEDTAPDAIVLDLAGLGSVYGAPEDIARQLAARARDLGLSPHVAVAAQIETALLAARGFSGIAFVPAGEESRHLEKLPVEALTDAPEIRETLDRWGVRTCGMLAALPVLDLSERLGQAGVHLHEQARGARSRSLVLAEPAIVFEEALELEDSVEELEPLAFVLSRLLGQLCARLSARSLAASGIHLRMNLEAAFGEEEARGKRRPAFYEKTFTFPLPLRDPQTILRLLRLQLTSGPPGTPILKISMAADSAAPRTTQRGLFVPGSPDPEKLELTVARLAHLVGESNVGSPALVDTHRPGEFRMSHFTPPEEERPKVSAFDPRHKPAAAFRVFRPAIPARVELRDERPVRLEFQGLRGEVVTASGPWRTSGDWWRKDAWQHDEWELETGFPLFPARRGGPSMPSQCRSVYRVYFDLLRGSWFVEGIYD